MKRSMAILAVVVLVLSVAVSAPVYALKVYSCPSVQTENTSPDGTYNEAYAMQDVSDRFTAKCRARGFETRDGDWMYPVDSCPDAVNWGANAFVSMHTDAVGGSGWCADSGTHGFFWKDAGGYYDPNDRDLCVKCVDQCVAQFGTGDYWGNKYDGDWDFYGYHLYVLNNTPNMNAILVEGLFHQNYNDCQVLKSSAGKDKYAEGLYRGVCQHYGYSFGAALDSSYNAQSYNGSLKGGQQATCWVEYKNTGTDTWSNTGSNPVRLGTWSPQDRNSIFYTAGDWPSANRPTAMDQASVASNGIGRFTFIMTAPKGNYGTFTEYWKLVSEYRAWFGYEGVWFKITTSPYDIVVDNNASGFSADSSWSTGTMSSDKYGADYRYHTTLGSTSNLATWTVNVPTSGNYDVYAWWPQGGNRSTVAPYKINYNGGSKIMPCNQQASGGMWNPLGRYNFNAGNNTVTMNTNVPVNYVVMADAIRFVGPY